MIEGKLYPKSQVVKYEYEVVIRNQLGRKEHLITITFVDGVFKRATFPFVGVYSRDQWKVLAMIEKEITKLEESYHG